MWIEERMTDSGIKYKYIERYKCPFSGKEKKVSITLASKSKQAQKTALYKLQEKIDKAMQRTVPDRTLISVIEEFLTTKKDFRKVTTQASLEYTCKALLPYLPSDILLSRLSIPVLQSCIDNFQKEHSDNYTRMVLTVLKQVIRYAFKMGYIDNISFLDVVAINKRPKSYDELVQIREKFLTKNELAYVLAAIKDINPVVSLILEFQALTGLRINELLGLRTQDFDSHNKTVTVSGTLSIARGQKGPQLLPPKNEYSYRAIQLDERSVKIIQHFMTANQARRLWKHNFKDTGFIFVTDGGNPFDYNTINKLLKKIDFTKHLTTHTFRHTHISLLAESNVPLKAIMARVGHNEPRTTLAVYTHVTDEMKKQVTKAVTSISQSIGNQ